MEASHSVWLHPADVTPLLLSPDAAERCQETLAERLGPRAHASDIDYAMSQLSRFYAKFYNCCVDPADASGRLKRMKLSPLTYRILRALGFRPQNPATREEVLRLDAPLLPSP
jgi:hypothetical protein